jgi:hypothetical protein
MSILDPANLRSFDDADQALDDAHHHHHRSEVIGKALGSEECRPGARRRLSRRQARPPAACG